MKNSDLRFYAVEHALMMLIAVLLIPLVGRARKKPLLTS
jgi:hypothetical protein